ncbi:transcription elongation factor GreB [bacterium BMS3Bbin05]|nr:transcription elongation factor GreB [bacterium BMS3Bbin05]
MPSPAKSKVSPYITPKGHKRLSEELTYLWKIKRPEVTRAVAEAAAMGDRSENAEYIYGKKQLREIDSRMRVLQRRLNELKIVDRPPEDTTKIFFGAWVELEDDDGNEYKYRIVGRDEFDPAKNYISIDSPMAKALLGKKEDDEVVVNRPNGETAFIVLSIQYPF